MPLVVDAISKKSYMHSESTGQLGAVACTDQLQSVLTETQEFSFKVKRWQVDQSGCCPILQSRINVDWFTFNPQMFAPLFSRLYDGIPYDVFIQKAAVAWDNAPNSRIMVSLLLPGPMEADQWLHEVRAMKARVWTKHATGFPYRVLHRRLFLHEFTEESRWLENSYKGLNEHRVKWQWKCCRDWRCASYCSVSEPMGQHSLPSKA